MEILEFKSVITKVKNLPEGLNNWYELVEENISQLECNSIEIIQCEE